VKVSFSNVERAEIRYVAEEEKFAALEAEADLREKGFVFVWSYHVKDDLMHYTGEAVTVMEKKDG